MRELGSIEKILELLSDAWRQKLTPKELSRKYKVGYFQIYRFLKDLQRWENIIVESMNQEDLTPKKFGSYPSIQKWQTIIRRSGHLSTLRHLSTLKGILGFNKNTIYLKGYSCSPEKFNLEEAQKWIDQYLQQNKNKTQVPQRARFDQSQSLSLSLSVTVSVTHTHA